MWPYNQDEMSWLALPRERAAAEQTQRAIAEAWLAKMGLPRQPANDPTFSRIRMVDPRR
jgi:hypothetical protein